MSDKILWSGKDFVRATKGTQKDEEQNTDWNAHGLSIDTRTIVAGDVFIALNGEQSDGHNYVSDAFAKGAVAALVQMNYKSDNANENLIRVGDPAAALTQLAKAARSRTHAHILAVTGSVGKTSVKESLRVGLQQTGATHASVQSFNNHIGVPLSLARMPADSEFAIFEIGMNHKGEIAELVQLVRPHTAIITQIAAAHIENFASLADIARAKAEIVLGVEKGGAFVFPADAPHADILRDAAEAAGVANIAAFSVEHPAPHGCATTLGKMKLFDTCSCITANINGTDIICKIGQAGAHHVSNALATLTAIDASGGDLALASLALAQSFMDADGVGGRGQRHTLVVPNTNTNTNSDTYILIDETYNANPASMGAALLMLGLVPRGGDGRRIAVLGDMAELGSAAPALHKDLLSVIETADIDMVMSCGTLMQNLHNVLPPERIGIHKTSAAELLAPLRETICADDVVMIKGSRAANMDMLVDALCASNSADNANTQREAV